ncbi:uncharacterized protein [Dermacentor albipictus]|uniref:uncharacterized protein isoform X2 n=1 Tax=Dermacentor albipictus TaxID=60249 RepID=UPI0038FC035C
MGRRAMEVVFQQHLHESLKSDMALSPPAASLLHRMETESPQANGPCADVSKDSPSHEEAVARLEESSEATEVYDTEWWQADGLEDDESPVHITAEYSGWRTAPYQRTPSFMTPSAVRHMDTSKLTPSACGEPGTFFSPSRLLEDRSVHSLPCLYDVEQTFLEKFPELKCVGQDASNDVADAADAVKVAAIILQKAIKRDSIMRRERHKLQVDVLLLKKAKLKLALERRSRMVI